MPGAKTADRELPLGAFVVGEGRFLGAQGNVSFSRDHHDGPWRMDLTIEATAHDAGSGKEEDDDDVEEVLPSLVIDRLMLDVADWRSLQGHSRKIADPLAEDAHDQNVFWGPHFENVVELTLTFGQIEGSALPISASGFAMRAILGEEDTELKLPLVIRAVCDLPPVVAPQATAEPPLGRKTCHACARVSFDQVPACPSCGAVDWWNPSHRE